MNSSLIFILSKHQKSALRLLAMLMLCLFIGRSIVSGPWDFLIVFLFFFLVWATYVSPLVGLGLVLGISVLAWTFRLPLPSWNVGPLFISSVDGVSMVLTASVGLRWVMKKSWIDLRSPTARLFLLFVVWMVLNILRGLSAYAESAVGEARPYIYFVVVALYVATYPLSRSQFINIARMWVVIGTILVATALLRWGGILPKPIGDVEMIVISASDWLQVRSLNAEETLFLLLMFFGLAILWIDRTPRQGIQSMLVKGGALFLFLLVVMMRHRSVWLAALTGGAVLLFYFRSRVSRLVWAGLFISLAIFTTLYLWQPGVLTSIKKTLYDSASMAWKFQGTTAEWRLKGWIDLLQHMSLQDYLFGKGYGAYFARETSFGSVAWNISPHSFYVRSLSRLGIVGLLMFLAFDISLLIRLARIPKSTSDKLYQNMAVILLVGIISCHTYFSAYSPSAYFGILLGMGMWLTREYAESEHE